MCVYARVLCSPHKWIVLPRNVNTCPRNAIPWQRNCHKNKTVTQANRHIIDLSLPQYWIVLQPFLVSFLPSVQTKHTSEVAISKSFKFYVHDAFPGENCNVLQEVNKNNIKICLYAFFASIPLQFFLTLNCWMGISVTKLYFNAHVIWYAGSRNIGKLGKQLFLFQTNKTCAELQWTIRFTCLKDSSNIVFLGMKKTVCQYLSSSHKTIFTKSGDFEES